MWLTFAGSVPSSRAVSRAVMPAASRIFRSSAPRRSWRAVAVLLSGMVSLLDAVPSVPFRIHGVQIVSGKFGDKVAEVQYCPITDSRACVVAQSTPLHSTGVDRVRQSVTEGVRGGAGVC